MTSMREIVNDALQTAGWVEFGDTPDDDEFSYSLTALNEMFHGWRAKGVDIGHATLDAEENVNLLEEHIEGAKLLLATHPRMVTRFGVPPHDYVFAEAKKAWNRIYAAYAAPGPAPANDGLAQMPSQRGRGSLF